MGGSGGGKDDVTGKRAVLRSSVIGFAGHELSPMMLGSRDPWLIPLDFFSSLLTVKLPSEHGKQENPALLHAASLAMGGRLEPGTFR